MNYKALNDLILPFIIGGATVAGIKYLSKNVGPEYAALLGALPVGYISTYFIKDDTKTKIYLKNYIWGLTSFIFCAIIYIMLLNNNINKNISLLSTTCLIVLLNFIRLKIMK